MNDVLINKKISIERCVGQIQKYYALESDLPFDKDHLRQDAIAMNLQRAVELCIDSANHLVRRKKLGLPQESRESFDLLNEAGLIEQERTNRLKAMVDFRNILVH